MTSAEDFPDEPLVPPVVLNSREFPLGTIVAVNRNAMTELRLPLNLRDDNIDDVLEVRATLSVLGDEDYAFVCAEPAQTTGEPARQPVSVVVQTQQLRQFACTKVEVFVSSDFSFECPPVDDDDERGFEVPRTKNDIARAHFWIWETSGNPLMNPTAARTLIESCQTEIATQSTPMPMVQ